MASKLCCNADQQSRTSSPDLPNARLSDATPAKRPLLPNNTASPASHFTSIQSEEIHELNQIFENARDEPKESSPAKARRGRFSRSSLYSLHGLHKMQSMHSIIKRRFSRDLARQSSTAFLKDAKVTTSKPEDPDTVIKLPRDGHNAQFKITKDNLRKDLFSEKKPAEGGYDPDAQVVEDFAKNMGKQTPSKRVSLHSIDWTPSTGSKPTPGSLPKSQHSPEASCSAMPYQISQSQPDSLAARFSHFFSAPNLRPDDAQYVEHKLRRSYSASSIDLPVPSPLSPMRLPSLTSYDKDGVPWSVSMTESLRLSQFPTPPSENATKPPRGIAHRQALAGGNSIDGKIPTPGDDNVNTSIEVREADIQIRVQEPTSTTTPRASTSIRLPAETPSSAAECERSLENNETEFDGDNPRRSVHLYSMRISQHLRSGSLLSWEAFSDAPDKPPIPRPFLERSHSEQSRTFHMHGQHARNDRQGSSSGFASSRVPSKWGKVLPAGEPNEDLSSTYSSRPHSPLDSLRGSMEDLSAKIAGQDRPEDPLAELASLKRFDTDMTENERGAKASVRDKGSTRFLGFKTMDSQEEPILPRNNSVAKTKKSKFREEFSPSPPKKRLNPSASIINFFITKKINMRSHSDTNLKSGTCKTTVDGPFDLPNALAHRERRLSKSVASLETERAALNKQLCKDPVWERALKAYQDERYAMFLPQNKDLAAQGSPYRERRTSIARPATPNSATTKINHPDRRLSTPISDPKAPSKPAPTYPQTLYSRRTALVGLEQELSPGQELKLAFDRQTDSKETVGAWGRYPSHTRLKRTASAGNLDHVEARDFALEATMQAGWNGNLGMDEDSIDPSTLPPSFSLFPGEKRRKRRVGGSRMAKSHSMTFGKGLLKNYARLFRSQSTEFQRHGRGHRSSITSGGRLEYPELEILPDIWRRAIVEERASESSSNNQHGGTEAHVNKGVEISRAGDSMATLRPFNENGRSAGDSANSIDGDARDHNSDRARIWSVYYEDCIANFPRGSAELDQDLEDFGAGSSFDWKSNPALSRRLPTNLGKHSRNESKMSRFSAMSRNSARPSFVSGIDDCEGGEGEGSIASVRRSTMDLLKLYKEQEVVERERVLSLMEGKGVRSTDGLVAL